MATVRVHSTSASWPSKPSGLQCRRVVSELRSVAGGSLARGAGESRSRVIPSIPAGVGLVAMALRVAGRDEASPVVAALAFPRLASAGEHIGGRFLSVPSVGHHRR